MVSTVIDEVQCRKSSSFDNCIRYAFSVELLKISIQKDTSHNLNNKVQFRETSILFTHLKITVIKNNYTTL